MPRTGQRYIIRLSNGELFGWYEKWLDDPDMVEYDPAIHGYRVEVAAAMGLDPPAPLPQPVVEVAVDPKPYVAGGTVDMSADDTELLVAQVKPAEPDLSGVFNNDPTINNRGSTRSSKRR